MYKEYPLIILLICIIWTLSIFLMGWSLQLEDFLKG